LDSFRLILIVIPEGTREDVLNLEQFLIDELNPAYNMRPYASAPIFSEGRCGLPVQLYELLMVLYYMFFLL
jgi:hypothetical protein